MPENEPGRAKAAGGWRWLLLIVPALIILMAAAIFIRHLRQPVTVIHNSPGRSWHYEPEK